MSGIKDENPFTELGFASNEAIVEPDVPDWDAGLDAAIEGLIGWTELGRSLCTPKAETIH